MATGIFVVSRNSNNNRDILFNLRESIPAEDEDQLSLRDDIDKTLVVLRKLFEGDEIKFETYFNPLLSLAQAGLTGSTASPKVAKRALQQLKNEVVASEAGKVKNKYMKELGKTAALMSIPVLISAVILSFFGDFRITYFLLLWGGCMVGVWLSFGARKNVLRFEDLHILEEDRLDPIVRLFFAGFLTVIIGLLFSTGAIVINLGSVSSLQINSSYEISLLIGMLSGISEKILPSKITKQASAFLNLDS